MKKIYYWLFLCLSIVFLWFLSGFWLPKGYAIVGHDSGLAVEASEFLKSRLYAWDGQSLGMDNSMHFGSIIMHSIDYLTANLSGVPYAGNRINLFFWISVLYTAAFIFSYSLRDRLGKYAPFIFPVFVVFNTYILQSVFILERAKYAVLALTLVFVPIIINVVENKGSYLKNLFIITLLFMFFNCGSWLGTPLFGNFLVVIASVVLYYLIYAIKDKKFESLLRCMVFLLISSISFVLINFYSIYPYASKFLTQDLSTVTSNSSISQNETWLNSLSAATSFFNIFRMQGVPDWYASVSEINPSHPYAEIYLNRPISILISCIFAAIAFSAFLLKNDDPKKKRGLILLGIIMLLGAFFTAGSHEPLGFIYKFFYNNIPGFSIFRSAYYKFGGAFYIGYVGLISYFISSLLERKNKVIGLVVLISSYILWFNYYQIIFNPGLLFSWQKEFSTRVRIPDYVYELSERINKPEDAESRILIVPAISEVWRNDGYNWGYWSLTNLPSSISTRKFVLNDDYIEGGKPVVSLLYQSIRDENYTAFVDYAKSLSIGSILLRKDALADLSWSSGESVDSYLKFLQNEKYFTKKFEKGDWMLFEINNVKLSSFNTFNNVVQLPKGIESLVAQDFGKSVLITEVGQVVLEGLKPFLNKQVELISCDSCPLERNASSYLPSVTIAPDSIIYFYKEYKDQKLLNSVNGDKEKVNAYLGIFLRKTSETMRMWNYDANDKFLISNLKKMNSILQNIEEIIDREEYFSDYSVVRSVLDFLNPAKRTFSNLIVSNNNFDLHQAGVRTEMIVVLWNIEKIFDKFSSVIESYGTLETQKSYNVSFSDNGKLALKLFINQLPRDLVGGFIKPTKVIYENGEEVKINPTVSSKDITFEIPQKGENKQAIQIVFDQLPNLYKSLGATREILPDKKMDCYKGKISSYNKSSLYRIYINDVSELQNIRLIIIDNDPIGTEKSTFLTGAYNLRIKDLLNRGKYSFIYDPSSGAVDPSIYVCNDAASEFNDYNIVIHEIVSPVLVKTTEMGLSPQKYAEPDSLQYERLSPTSYKIQVRGSKGPFMLSFNEKYSPLWVANISSDLVTPLTHFQGNGFENIWIVNKSGDFDLDVNYLPQRNFYTGLYISLGYLTIFSIVMIIKKWKK